MGRSGQCPAGRGTHPVVCGRRLTARQLVALRATPAEGLTPVTVSEIGAPLAQLRALETLGLVRQTADKPACFLRTGDGTAALDQHTRVGGGF